ncbi:MAG: MATE family efflux transporter [Spirochaetaceae bacterium]|jgi:putative MATE family efflux protein|nr:MATE family efflux transporter [Spirochaetaceae bacterium]
MNPSDQQNAKYDKMTRTPVEKLVCTLAVPSILIMMISALYNMADTYFVAYLGTSAIAGVGVVFPLMAVIQALGFFFGHGSGSYIAREMGARRAGQASRMAATSFIIALLSGALIALSGICFIARLAGVLGSTETILPYACDYMFFILLGSPWMMGSITLNCQLRYQGNAISGLVGMISGALLNIGLDPVLIFVVHMGVRGAALATMSSQFVSCTLLFIMTRTRGDIPVRFGDFCPRLSVYREMTRGGIPSLARQGIASIAAALVNHVAGSYGDTAIAALSIVNRVFWFCISALTGFGQGFQPVCSFNYGAGLFDRVKRAYRFCTRTAFIVMSFMGVLLFVFAPRIIMVFRSDDPRLIEIGSLAMRFQCAVLPLSAWIVLSNMMMQTVGKTVRASVMAASRQGIFLIPVLFALSRSLGLLGVELSQPLADIFAFMLSVPLSRSVFGEMKDSP